MRYSKQKGKCRIQKMNERGKKCSFTPHPLSDFDLKCRQTLAGIGLKREIWIIRVIQNGHIAEYNHELWF